MKTVPVLTRSLAVSLMLALAAPVVALADPTAPPSPGKAQRAEKFEAMRTEHMKAELNELANRLQLTAGQQASWEQYEGARLSMLKLPHYHQTPTETATQIAKMRAMRADQMAQLLDNLSTATAQLRVVLQPNQQQVLDEYARDEPKRMREEMKKMREKRGDMAEQPGN